jgi:hypothetical protein
MPNVIANVMHIPGDMEIRKIVGMKSASKVKSNKGKTR